MKLLKTIRADRSDTFVFEKAAEPGEWAVSGAFAFAHIDPTTLAGKARAAFRAGFLGLNSLGRSTLAQVVHAEEQDLDAATDLLSRQLLASFGAPDLAIARLAAADELAFVASLCDQPDGMLVAVTRRYENGETRELFRTLSPRLASGPIRTFALDRGEGDLE